MEDIRAIRFWLARAGVWSWVAFFLSWGASYLFGVLSNISGAWVTRLFDGAGGSNLIVNSFLVATVIFTVRARKSSGDWVSAALLGMVHSVMALLVGVLGIYAVSWAFDVAGQAAAQIAVVIHNLVLPAIGAAATLFTALWFIAQIWLFIVAKASNDSKSAASIAAELTEEAFSELWGYVIDRALGSIKVSS